MHGNKILIRRDPSGWLFGQTDLGEAGWFPETFVEKVMDERGGIEAPVETPLDQRFLFNNRDSGLDGEMNLRDSLLKKSLQNQNFQPR